MEKIFCGSVSDLERILKQSFSPDHPANSMEVSIEARGNLLLYRAQSTDRAINERGGGSELQEKVESFIKNKYPDKQIKVRVCSRENIVVFRVWTPTWFAFSLD